MKSQRGLNTHSPAVHELKVYYLWIVTPWPGQKPDHRVILLNALHYF